MRTLAAALALAALPAAASADTSVEQLVAKMQRFYEKTKSFDTRFSQSFQQVGMATRLGNATSKGRIRFQKPEGHGGPRMRWDYDDGRVVLLAGDDGYTFDPDTKQATEYRIDPSQLSTVRFLWGKGKLPSEFEIKKGSRTDLEQGAVLELTPRKPTSYQKLYLVVDPAKGEVRQSVVVQQSGAENRITFENPRFDAEMPPSDFVPEKAFPEGTTIVKAAIPSP